MFNSKILNLTLLTILYCFSLPGLGETKEDPEMLLAQVGSSHYWRWKGHGTAWILGILEQEVILVSAKHSVVKEGRLIRFKCLPDTSYNVHKIYMSLDAGKGDVAVFSVLMDSKLQKKKQDLQNGLEMSFSSPLYQDQELLALGLVGDQNARQQPLEIESTVSGYKTANLLLGDSFNRRVLSLDTYFIAPGKVHGGNSGAPVFSHRGRVIGMAVHAIELKKEQTKEIMEEFPSMFLEPDAGSYLGAFSFQFIRHNLLAEYYKKKVQSPKVDQILEAYFDAETY